MDKLIVYAVAIAPLVFVAIYIFLNLRRRPPRDRA